jgi:hypothetical protein
MRPADVQGDVMKMKGKFVVIKLNSSHKRRIRSLDHGGDLWVCARGIGFWCFYEIVILARSELCAQGGAPHAFKACVFLCAWIDPLFND